MSVTDFSIAQTQVTLTDVLQRYSEATIASINCIQYGKIETYAPDTQTAEVQLQSKIKFPNGETKDYPLLVDCPVIVLQGGGAFIDFPIAKGDYCIVFFNDTDIDNWWDSGSVTEPNSQRRHNLSDGFVLVGVNTKISPLGLDGDKVRIILGGHDLVIDDGTDFMVRYNELETAFNQLKEDFDNHVHSIASGTFVVSVTGQATGTLNPNPVDVETTTPSTADISNAKIDNINVPGVGE